jgi:hypothetical protein
MRLYRRRAPLLFVLGAALFGVLDAQGNIFLRAGVGIGTFGMGLLGAELIFYRRLHWLHQSGGALELLQWLRPMPTGGKPGSAPRTLLHLMKASAEIDVGAFDAALQTLAAIASDPLEPPARSLWAAAGLQARLMAGHIDEARHWLAAQRPHLLPVAGQDLRAQSISVRVYLALAMTRYYFGEEEASRHDFELLLNEPRADGSLKVAAACFVGLSALKQGDLDTARRQLEACCAAGPDLWYAQEARKGLEQIAFSV